MREIPEFAGVLGLLAMILGVLGFAGVIGWILRPLDQAAEGRQYPAQFSVADLLCLFFLIQLWMAPLHWWTTPSETPEIWVLDFYGWGSTGAMWWFCSHSLSRAGVRNTGHRVLFLAVIVPVALCGSLGGAVMALVIVERNQDKTSLFQLLSAIAAQIALVAAVYFCGRLTRRIVAQAALAATNPRVPDGADDAGTLDRAAVSTENRE